ncbi:hypothetical protein VCHENC02_4814A, partial [Vibrio harveyi]
MWIEDPNFLKSVIPANLG